MNLHIVPDNVFINKFYENLKELNLAENNRIVVRTNNSKLKYLKHEFPFSPLYTPAFDTLTGDTGHYEKVFIHQFTPLLYRWVAKNRFRELNWMVWGSDLYNLPFVDAPLYETLTLRQYVKQKISLQGFLYRAKVYLLHHRHRKEAYRKVSNVLTWMDSEYDFARTHLPDLNAAHKFFFYENDIPYQALDELLVRGEPQPPKERPVYVLGNSATPELNHLDAVALLEAQGLQADLCIPVSYGDEHYARFLKKNMPSYSGGELRFVDQYMRFDEYLQFINRADGLIMNNIRPQGYGNILMMMYLGKKIFLNEKNFSIPELQKSGLKWESIREVKVSGEQRYAQNKLAVSELLSHDSLLKRYRELFS